MPNLPAMPATGPAGPATAPTLVPNGTEGQGDARGWLRGVLRIVRPSAGRSEVLTTDRDLQTGPAPAMIVRRLADLSHGLTGPRMMNSFPNDGSEAYIPHQPIIRNAGIAMPLRTYDDGASIPAIYAGNSVKG